MDGGRRLLESMTGALASGLAARFQRGAAAPFAPLAKPGPRMARPGRRARMLRLVSRPGFGVALVLALLGGAGAYGFVRGGHYDVWTAELGRPADLIGRALGFGVSVIAFSGQQELLNAELLEASGVTTRDSLLFVDAQAVRLRVKAMPLVREATVRKLYPDQLLITVTERKPYALWQFDGEVSVISADGTAIDKMRDQRFSRLPFVVGDGANERVPEYLSLAGAAGELKSRIVAGTLVGQRRWNLKLNNGVDIRLPENGAEAAIARLAALARDHKLPDKDVIAIDMRAAGRVIVRLSEEAAQQRLEARSRKIRPKGSAA